jgi:putative tricarboxylic transport membrane protein
MKKDQALGLFLMAFAAYMYYQASQLPPAMFGALGADIFPKLLFILLVVFGAALFIQTTIKTRREVKTKTTDRKSGNISDADNQKTLFANYKYVIIGFTSFCLYVVLMYYLGYVIATLIFMPLFMWILGPKTKKAFVTIVIVSLALTFGMQYGFANVLKVFLPTGAVF